MPSTTLAIFALICSLARGFSPVAPAKAHASMVRAPLLRPATVARGVTAAKPAQMVAGGIGARVVQGATQGAVGAVVAAALSAFTEPVVNRILVQRISVMQSIKEMDVEKSKQFFKTTLTTNFLKFPLFEALNAAMMVLPAPDAFKGAITGLVFTTATLPITNYRFCKSMDMEVNKAALFKAYLPTVGRDIVYGISRNKLNTAMRAAFPALLLSSPGRAALLFPVVCGACIISSPGNELRGYYLQPKEKRLGMKAFFKPVNYARSTFAGALIMAISLSIGAAVTGPLQVMLSALKALALGA